MPLAYCAGTCGRMISISSIPGGNPEALAHPESFAIHYVQCKGCRRMYCDRCAPATCACGGALATPTLRDKEAFYPRSMLALQRIADWKAAPAPTGPPQPGEPTFLRGPIVDPAVARMRELFFKGMTLHKVGRSAEARAALDAAVSIEAHTADSLAFRGWVREIVGHAGARVDLEAALAAAPPGWARRADVELHLTAPPTTNGPAAITDFRMKV